MSQTFGLNFDLLVYIVLMIQKTLAPFTLLCSITKIQLLYVEYHSLERGLNRDLETGGVGSPRKVCIEPSDPPSRYYRSNITPPCPCPSPSPSPLSIHRTSLGFPDCSLLLLDGERHFENEEFRPGTQHIDPARSWTQTSWPRIQLINRHQRPPEVKCKVLCILLPIRQDKRWAVLFTFCNSNKFLW